MVTLTRDIRIIKELIDSQYLAVLSTASAGIPFSYLVFFAATSDLRQMVFATERNTHKYLNMQGNSRVCLQIDNRSNEPTDIFDATGITVIGQAGEDKRKRLSPTLLNRHPELGAFLENPDCALMRVRVQKYIIARFSETREVVMR
jgi:hypothetical protein